MNQLGFYIGNMLVIVNALGTLPIQCTYENMPTVNKRTPVNSSILYAYQGFERFLNPRSSFIDSIHCELLTKLANVIHKIHINYI